MKRFTRSLRLLLGISFLMIPACKGKEPVELKQDTPESVVSTFIKLYESGDYARLDSIADGFILRARARSEACSDEKMLELKCKMERMECMKDRFAYCKRSKECEGFKARTCLCDGKGVAAADAAPAFTKSKTHELFLGLILKAKRCKISSLEFIDYQSKYLAADEYCGDITKDEQLRAITIECGGRKEKLIVRGRGDTWFIGGLDSVAESVWSLTSDMAKSREKTQRD